jgi:hypothetical protein
MDIAGAVDAKELSSSGAILIAVAARSIFGEFGFNALLISAIVSSITCLSGGRCWVACFRFSGFRIARPSTF